MNHFNITAIIPSCPESTEGEPSEWDFPSTIIICAIASIVNLILALFVGLKNNSFQVQGRAIRVDSITNDQWVAYFASNSFRACFTLFRLAIEYQYRLDLALAIVYLIFSGLSALFLSLALNHQYLYRSAFAPRVHDEEIFSYRGEVEPPPSCTFSDIVNYLLGIQTPLFILYVLYLLSIYVEFTVSSDHTLDSVFWPLFLVFYFIQRLPIIIFTILIISNQNLTEGPTVRERVILSIAIVLNVVADVPASVWGAWVRLEKCVFHFASLVDMVYLFYILSLILLVIFVRQEFLRTRLECSWRVKAFEGTAQ